MNRVNVLAWYGGVVRVDEVVRIVLYQYPLRADFAQSVLIKDGQMLGDIGLIAAGLVNAPGDDALCVDAQNGAPAVTLQPSLRFGIVGVVQGVGILGDQTRQLLLRQIARAQQSITAKINTGVECAVEL